MVLPLAWQPQGTGRQVLGDAQPVFPASLPASHVPQLHASQCCVGWLCSLLLAPWENAVLEHAHCMGDSHFAMPPLAALADTKSSWHDPYKHSSLRHHRLLGDFEVLQLPLSAGVPGGTQHPKGMLNPSLNQALLAYFQAFADAIFSTLIFNPPSLSKPIFPNLKFPDAF